MKAARLSKRFPRGFVSYVLVLTTGVVLTILMLSAYKRAASAQVVQKETQIRVDYAQKEEAVIRSIINIAPNRAIRAMKSGANATSSSRDPLRWQNIFSEALDQANARDSISASLKSSMGSATGITANVGDSTLTNVNSMFDAIEPEPGYMSPGVNRSLGTGFPVPLNTTTTVAANDAVYPIISYDKKYGALAQGKVLLSTDDATGYTKFNKIPYPNIRFGYCAPGQPFVAKRNWWAFSLQLGENDALLNSFARNGGSEGERDFILSIYEIPSQLAISAEAFTSLGAHADGTVWKHATIEGGIYSTRAAVTSGMELDRLSSRRGMTLGSNVTVGGKDMGENPFKPGEREKFELENGTFQPVTMASEAGRAAFIPINRGAEFFDRFTTANRVTEANTLSPTTWNTYSSGAMQCAMRLDITKVASSTNPLPTKLQFSYMNASGTRVPIQWPLEFSEVSSFMGMQAGFAGISGSRTFTEPVDLVYGTGGKWAVKYGVTGFVTFDDAYFGGDPNPESNTANLAYWRPQSPWEVKMLHGTRYSIAVYPERIQRMLEHFGLTESNPASPLYACALNPSLVVNVDYTQTNLYPPSFPAAANDYAVLLYECDDLTDFKEKGFSLVTNMRLYIGDDFNVVSTTAPTNSGLPSPYYPAASLFAPEKRYGTDLDPFEVKITGQLGHLGGDTGASGSKVHLLDLKNGSETETAKDRINVNLKPITHPAELPPITMMNWLVVVEERHKEFYTGNGTN